MSDKGQLSIFYLIIFLLIIIISALFFSIITNLDEKIDIFIKSKESIALNKYYELHKIMFAQTNVEVINNVR